MVLLNDWRFWIVFAGVIAGSWISLIVLNSSPAFIAVLVAGGLLAMTLRGRRGAQPVAKGLAATVLGVMLVCLVVWILFLQTRI